MLSDTPNSSALHPRLQFVLELLETGKLQCMTDEQLFRFAIDGCPDERIDQPKIRKKRERAVLNQIDRLVSEGRVKRTSVHDLQPELFTSIRETPPMGDATPGPDARFIDETAVLLDDAKHHYREAMRRLHLDQWEQARMRPGGDPPGNPDWTPKPSDFVVTHAQELDFARVTHVAGRARPVVLAEVLSLICQQSPEVASSWHPCEPRRVQVDYRDYGGSDEWDVCHVGSVLRGSTPSAVLIVEHVYQYRFDFSWRDIMWMFYTALHDKSKFNAMIFGDSDAGMVPCFEIWMDGAGGMNH